MTQTDEPTYDRRTVEEWVAKAQAGKIAVTDFQRSFVWDSNRATSYIKAIFMGKPVGVYLLLSSSPHEPQFGPRPFSVVNLQLTDVEELVLDGQQRLTSLLHALYKHPERRFYIKVVDITADDLEVEDIVVENRSSAESKGLDDPATAFSRSHIPIDILPKTKSLNGLTPLANWCIDVGTHGSPAEAHRARILEDKIRNFVDAQFFGRNIWFCLLPESTRSEEAVDIFVDTNTSSVRIKHFDIEVAKARGSRQQDLRAVIQGAYKSSDILRYYFPDDPEQYIPDIGEWLLKVACLHRDRPPKVGNYGEAMTYLLGGTKTPEPALRMNEAFKDLNWALKQAEEFGAPTSKAVPSWPVLHVLAALRSRMEGVSDPGSEGALLGLLRTYYWRCLFSNRHETQANDRLWQDHRQLLKAFDAQQVTSPPLTAFDTKSHPLFDKGYLLRRAGWINSSKLGKALASLVMASDPKPKDWITTASLAPPKYRDLQEQRKLDKHHVFPKATLAGHVDPERVWHGLNGVVLGKSTNQRLWKRPPDEYVQEIADHYWKGQRSDLRKRIESHLVPFEELTSSTGPISRRYERYLSKRAELVYSRIKEVANP